MAQSRGGTPTGVRATLSRAPHPIDAEVKTLRLSAFRFPFYFVPSFVIAGLDPAIHGVARLSQSFR